MPDKRRRRIGPGCTWMVLLLLFTVGFLGYSLLRPQDPGPPQYLRFEQPTALSPVIDRLRDGGIVRDDVALRLYAQFTGRGGAVAAGTYQLRPGMTADEVLRALRSPISRTVRLPEGWWVARTAERLQREGVAPAADYRRLAADPARFAATVSFALPKGSLEGYLFPDSYDLPPLLGAEATVRRQLRAFERKVVPLVPPGKDLHRTVIVASMVELEAALDSERARIAGVIENRLRRRMRLEIDATVLYALQEWKQLGPGVVRTVESPYNTYLNPGLPPGPICSPGVASVKAALTPEQHGYLFYVARPDRSHLFAATYREHLANIRRARAEARATGAR